MDLSLIACGLSEIHLTDWRGKPVHKSIIADLTALANASKQAGFDLTIASAFRNFQRQATIWNSKFLGQRPVYDINNCEVELATLSEIEKCKAIMLFSALPGASRHHFGSDLDIYAKNCLNSEQSLQLAPWEYQSGGPFSEFSAWLDENLTDFGFFKPYATYNGGVAQEPWHISHITTSEQLEQHQNIDAIADAISQHDILGKQTILVNLKSLHEQFVTNIIKV
ncbi:MULTISPECIES: M15 family metallopeptidase [Pseudoalteromonas]|uniref:Peptidase M15 n=1 Tax=Pseudoalteromonas amylolytica TaxID=1859457 RepID=A0A1S1MT47_9GAMM|nr:MULTISPECIES: M15 family metallopeptidase [Pseudoalteromonas]OHU86923.1 peptidase M15 [Pseudoalteromonas sp. JW3]OHU88367.1 peptidase M15 [Pseudoalteromonas amylolytica]